MSKFFGIDFKPGTFQKFTPDGWVDICHATTWLGAEHCAKKIFASATGYGDLKNPNSGLRYGTVRLVPDDGSEHWAYDFNLGPIPPQLKSSI
jgi:hypothetical protein